MNLFDRVRKKPPEVTPSGSPILRYDEGHERPLGFADAPAEWAQEREAFYGRFFGKCDGVIHELIPQIPHIDIFIYAPNQERNFYTVISSGLSDHLMNAPKEVSLEKRRVEMFMRVPAIKVELYAIEHPWQIGILRYLSRFPVEHDTWIGEFHTLPNGDPPQPVVAGSELTTTIFMPPAFESKEFQRGITFTGGTRASFLWVDFLTTGECDYKLNNGSEARLSLLDQYDHPHVLDIGRHSYI